ncbi:MAG: DUF6044 family protein [Bacteroidota bacterium]
MAVSAFFSKIHFTVFASSRWKHSAVALGLISLQFLPYCLLWDNAYIRIHDTLEGIDYILLFRSGLIFDYSDGAVLEQILGGLPRKAVKTGWSVVALWHGFFGLYWGYLLNFITVHTIALAGMYLVLKDHFLQNGQEKIALGVAVIFSWVPFFTMLGISVAGQPVLAWALLNLLPKNNRVIHQKKWVSWGIITLFPFYSDIVWAGLPLLFLAGLAWLVFIFHKKQERDFWNQLKQIGHWKVPFALIWMALIFICLNFQLFEISFLDISFDSHREEYSYFYNKPLSWSSSLVQAVHVFFLSHYHVGVFFGGVVLMALGQATWDSYNDWRFKYLIGAIACLCVFYGCYNWVVWFGGNWFPLLVSFKFERVVVVLPFLWLIVFALALTKIKKKLLVNCLFLVQLAIGIMAHDEFQHNVRQLLGLAKKPNFKEFFDEKLFSEIAQHIGQPQHSYKVVNLGIHPAVAQFNGFYTLDGHSSLYRLSYKHQFRKIMEDEISKNEVVQKEFDHFGNRCYLFSSELGKDYTAFYQHKNQRVPVKELKLNTNALQALNGDYLLSSVEVGNAEEIGIRLEKVFEREDSYWRIYLYVVTPRKLIN